MSASRRIAFGAAAQWISRGVSIVLGLVMMPVLLANLPKEEVGLWLLLSQSWAILGILDLGFGVTLIRRIALAKGKSGGTPDTPLSENSLEEIANLIAIGKKVYRFLAIFTLIISCSLGFYYLKNLELTTTGYNTVWTAWLILCLCQALNIWASTWICLLSGMGYVGWDALLATTINTFTLLSQIAAVFIGGGIVTLATIAMIGSLTQRILIQRFCLKRNPQVFELSGKWNWEIFKSIPRSSLKAWLSILGTMLVFNTDNFFIGLVSSVDDIPAYRGATLVVMNLHLLTCAVAQSSSVFISQLWQAGETKEAQRLIKRNLQIGACCTICGGVTILALGETFFNVWLGPSNYIGSLVLSTMVILIIFEQQSFIISTSCRATDHEPFAVWMMIGGIIKLSIAVPLINRLGLFGLALSTVVAQFATAYWFVAKHGLRRLNIPFSKYLKLMIPVGLGTGVLTTALCLTAWHLTHATANEITVASVCLSGGIALGLSSWIFILNTDQRKKTLAWLRLSRLN